MRCAARRCVDDAAVSIDRGGGVVQVACDRHADAVALFEPTVRVRELRRRTDGPPQEGPDTTMTESR